MPTITSGRRNQCATGDDEMNMKMILHGLSPGMQDHREPNLTAQIFLSEFFQELRGGVDEEFEERFLIEGDQGIEDMVDGEDDVVIGDGQQPFLLLFEPLGFLEGTALGTVTILAGFVVELPLLTNRAFLHHTAEGRGATLQDRTHCFGLLIGKAMCASVVADVFAEDLSHIVLCPGLLC